jgi:WD40 repeat protein
VVKGIPAGWGTCSRTVVLSAKPWALASWKETVAVGSELGDITLLNAITGSQVAVLSGHTKRVRSLACLPDGTSLVSGSEDEKLKLWDIQTGGVIKTFYGHMDWVESVSVSSDSTTIASGSCDMTIRLWKIQTGRCHCIIKQQVGVAHVVFSPTDPQRLISVSDGVVKQWNTNGTQIGPTLQGHHAAFSSDGTHFVMCGGEVAMVQNTNSGATVAKFSPGGGDPQECFNHCCFSPDGGLVAIAARTTIYIWDITSSDPHLVETLIGHTYDITSITFPSSSLISTSDDMSIKFWQVDTPSTDSMAADTSHTPLTFASIQSITLQAKDNIAISSDSAGVVRVWDISTGLCKTSYQTPAKGQTQRAVQMIDGKLIFVWHMEQQKEIYIWDIEKGESLQTVEARSWVGGLRISGDGSKIFCLDGRFIQAWSMWTGEAVGKVKVRGWPHLDPLHVDGSRIWVCFKDMPPQGWDFEIPGSSPVPLSNTSSERPHLYFVNHPTASDPARIRNAVTGKKVFQLSGRYAKPSAAGWDGQYLVAGYGSGEVVILDCYKLCA